MWPWEGGFGLREACLVPRQRSLWDRKGVTRKRVIGVRSWNIWGSEKKCFSQGKEHLGP